MLELLLADEPRTTRPVVLPRLVAVARDPLADALLDAAPGGRRRLLPEPSPDTEPTAVRRWYRDLWHALPEAERARVQLAAGAGAACLAPLVPAAQLVAVVRSPLQMVGALAEAGVQPPKARVLLALADDAMRSRARVRGAANPQARALLLPRPDADGLEPTLGPPGDAERWRGYLSELRPSLRAVRVEDVAATARSLAEELGYPRRAAVRAGKLASRFAPAELSLDRDHAELLSRLDWLDGELFAQLTAAG